jgi:hypothetical protein
MAYLRFEPVTLWMQVRSVTDGAKLTQSEMFCQLEGIIFLAGPKAGKIMMIGDFEKCAQRTVCPRWNPSCILVYQACMHYTLIGMPKNSTSRINY